MQFVVTATDFTDADALDRRMANRAAHLAGVKVMIANGTFLSGGAMLDDSGKMVGSILHLEFPDRASLEKQLQADPYISGKVWEHIHIMSARLVPLK